MPLVINSLREGTHTHVHACKHTHTHTTHTHTHTHTHIQSTHAYVLCRQKQLQYKKTGTCQAKASEYLGWHVPGLKIVFIMFIFSAVSPFGTVNLIPNIIKVNDVINNITFTCKSVAGPNLTYRWLINGNSEALNSSDVMVNCSELTVNYVSYLIGGTCTCIVTNMAGEGRSSGDLFSKL